MKARVSAEVKRPDSCSRSGAERGRRAGRCGSGRWRSTRRALREQTRTTYCSGLRRWAIAAITSATCRPPLDVHEELPGGLIEHVAEQAGPGLAGQHLVVQAAHRAPAQPGVMDEDELAVGGAADVDLDPVEPAWRTLQFCGAFWHRSDDRGAPLRRHGRRSRSVRSGAQRSQVRGGRLSSAADGHSPTRLFLVLMADQLAAGWLPAYGHSVVQAPHLSSLAEAGTTVRVRLHGLPLRAGTRGDVHRPLRLARRVYDNAEFRAGRLAVVHALRAAGYHTVVTKGTSSGPTSRIGLEERLTGSAGRRLDAGAARWTSRCPGTSTRGWRASWRRGSAPGMQTDYDEDRLGGARYEIARHRAEQPFFVFVPCSPIPMIRGASGIATGATTSTSTRRHRPLWMVDPSRRLRHVPGGPGPPPSRSAAPATVTTPRSPLPGRAHHQVLLELRRAGLRGPHHGPVLRPWRCWGSGAPGQDGIRARRRSSSAPRAGWARVSLTRCRWWTSRPRCSSWPGDGRRRRTASSAGAIGGGPAAIPARPVVSEYHAEGVQAPSAMVRCGRHKLIVSPQDPDLLYDLEADPDRT